ncbi:MAG: hypothetical protein EOM59_06205 [Clostridia bacterium]|nr:hypothetical protein [Clostridia bacterium]
MDFKCFCGSDKLFRDCCFKKYKSIEFKTNEDLSKLSDYEKYGSARFYTYQAICKKYKFNNKNNGNVIIFGAGKCFDLPMDFITEIFDKIILVDVSKNNMEIAYQYIPKEYIDKVITVVWDVTGICEKHIPQIDAISSECEIYKLLNDLGQSLPVTTLPDDVKKYMPYSFVISDLILTQLPLSLNMKYFHLNGIALDANYMQDFINGLIFQHLMLLHTVAKDKGNVLVLTDTFSLGKEFDGSEGTINFAIKQNVNLIDSRNITLEMITEWLSAHSLAGSNIYFPMKKNNFNKFRQDNLQWWWWAFSEDRRYLVLCYHFTNNYEDVALIPLP